MLIIANSTIYFLMILLSPLLGLLINLLFYAKNFQRGSRIASLGIWIGFINVGIAWFLGLPFSEKNESWGFIANEISWLMGTVILFISAIVHHFSLRYMEGDRNYRRYFLFLNLITISTFLMVAADNIVILISFWVISNGILVVLMTHKFQWAAAKNSGILALKTFVLGLGFFIAGAGLLIYGSGSFSLNQIGKTSESLSPSIRMIALFFIILVAFSQSGGWPFHRWLISSLNSPTPVSAFMHAGLVNGGGLLLTRFAPIFLQESLILNILFVLSMITLVLGGIWKLLQADIKRMLACSTLTQMGFMMMQCSLGLFPAALAHLCWHGLFKAFLFLKSGSTISEHRHTNEERVSTIPRFFLSSLCGLIGASGFILGGNLSFNLVDTTTILIFFAWMASTQFAHNLLQKKLSIFFVLIASISCLATGIIYGLTVALIEAAVASVQISQPQPLSSLHLIAITLIFGIWIALNLKPFANHEGSLWWRRLYVRMLNASQPDPQTITSIRNGYKF
ncbi:MAG: proton-conducting membrane transporter [Parachlamydia sp.]|nr:MAG: proton-conducting membrane transporter [Parachlamydia sp.]